MLKEEGIKKEVRPTVANVKSESKRETETFDLESKRQGIPVTGQVSEQ